MPGYNPPILGTSKLVTRGMTGFSYYATLFAAMDLWASKQGENIMIFADDIPMWILIVAMVFGSVLLIFSKSWYLYEDKRKHSTEAVKWDHTYTIAIIATLVCAIASSYMIIMYGLEIFIEKQITDVGMAFLLCFIVGVVSAYFYDAIFPKYLADGRLAKAYADGQAIIREKLASEEVQKKALELLKQKAVALGVPEDRVTIFCKMAEKVNTEDLGALTKVADIVKTTDPKALEVFYADKE